MIPMAPGFFKPTISVTDVCEETYGAGYYTEILDSFGTDGNLNGASAETSPNNSWTYSGTSSVRSGGVVSPAVFTASGDQAAMYKSLVSVTLGGEERLQIKFFGVDYTLFVELTRSSGTACFFRFIGATETIEDTFSIGLGASVTIGIDGAASDGSLSLYVSPDLVTTPVATISEGLDPFPTSFALDSFEFWCEANASVDFIRVCGFGI